jgi:hypothetical protein
MALSTPERSFTRIPRLGQDGRPNGASVSLAAQEIRITDPHQARYLHSLVSVTKNHLVTHNNPWDWYDRLGEVHYAISRAGRIAGYTQLFAEYEESPGQWVRRAGPANAIVEGIYSPYGGVRGLISRYFTLMKVPADSHLIRVKNGDVYDGYHFLSVDEIDQANLDRASTGVGAKGLVWKTLPLSDAGDTMTRQVAAEDYLGRVWVPSDRFVDMPESPLFALDTECEVLYYSTQAMKAKLASRFASAGMLFVPQSMRSAAWAKPENGEIEGVRDATKIDDVLSTLIKSMMRGQDTFDKAQYYLPIIVSGPDEVGEKIRHIVMDQEIFETDIEIRRELIDRILMGLDIQQQATKGIGESAHWSAWAVSDEELRLVAKPDVEAACWAFTRLILHRQLRAQEMSDTEIVKWRVGFHMNEAASKTNLQEDARQLEDRGHLKGSTARAVSGFDEDDAPDEQEQIRWAGRQSRNPYLMLFKGEIADIDWEEVLKFSGKTGPSGKVGDDPKTGPGVGDPGSPNEKPGS